MTCLKERKVFSNCDDHFLQDIRFAAVYPNRALIVTHQNVIFRIIREGGAPMTVTPFCSSDIKSLKINSYKYFVLTNNHELYMSSNNEKYTLQFSAICTEHNIKQFSCGSYHGAILTVLGKIFTFSINDDSMTADLTEQGSKTWTSVVCGGYFFTAAIDDTKQLYVWRQPSGGPKFVTKSRPGGAPIMEDVKQVACGQYHVIILTHSDKMFSFGYNDHGQLGLGHVKEEFRPVQITTKQTKILRIGSYRHISWCWDEDKKLYAWGKAYLVPTHLCGPPNNAQAPFGGVTTLPDLFKTFDAAVVKFNNFSEEDEEDLPMYKENEATVSQWKEDILEKFVNSKYTDFTITVGGKNIEVVQMILIERSEYFKSLFSTTLKEKEAKVLVVDNYSYPVYRTYIDYLYSGRVDITLDSAPELYSLAHYYLDEELKTICANFLRNKLSAVNVIEIYKMATQYEAEDLKDKTIIFMKDNYHDLLAADRFMGLTTLELNELFKIILN